MPQICRHGKWPLGSCSPAFFFQTLQKRLHPIGLLHDCGILHFANAIAGFAGLRDWFPFFRKVFVCLLHDIFRLSWLVPSPWRQERERWWKDGTHLCLTWVTPVDRRAEYGRSVDLYGIDYRCNLFWQCWPKPHSAKNSAEPFGRTICRSQKAGKFFFTCVRSKRKYRGRGIYWVKGSEPVLFWNFGAVWPRWCRPQI